MGDLMPNQPPNTVGMAPTSLLKLLTPRWFAWRAKHAEEHASCEDEHDRKVWGAGFLVGGGVATQVASEINPAFHDAVRLLLWMKTADEEIRPELVHAAERLLEHARMPMDHELIDPAWRLVRREDLTALREALAR